MQKIKYRTFLDNRPFGTLGVKKFPVVENVFCSSEQKKNSKKKSERPITKL